jgi:hypothetical protein
LIDRIPKPPIWPGKRNQAADDYQAMQGEEDCMYNGKGKKTKNIKQHYIESLTTREISMLSQVAWDVLKPKYDHPAPTVAIKWKSPDSKTFTSRKTAWEYATHLSKQEVIIERNLNGLGASGKMLKEFVPSAKTALEVGNLRFIRDGLWVVGQGTSWQAGREEELLAQEEDLEEVAASKVYTSGLQLYVAENRHRYRDEHGTNLTQADKALRHQWRCLPPKEQEVWNEKVQEQFEDSSDEESDAEEEDENKPANITVDGSDEDANDESDESSDEYISHYQYFVLQRRHDYRHQQQMKLEANDSSEKKKFTLAQADKELRQQWKEMDEQQQDDWIAKLKQMEDEEVQAEDEQEEISKKENKAGDTVEGEAVAITTGEIAVGSKITKITKVDKVDSGDQVITESTLTTTKTNEENNGKDRISKEPSNRIGFEEEKKTEEDDFDAKQSQSMVMDPAKNHTVPDSVDSNANIPSSVKVSAATKTKGKSTGKKSSENNNSTTKTTGAATKQAKKQSTRQVTTPKYCLKPKQINQCYNACMEHYETVMRTVKTRDLSRELADGFDVLRERGHGRFDMEIPAFETPEYDFLNSFEKTSWMPIVRSILGEDVVLIHKGAFMSLPGAGAQVYHQDGVHLTTQTQRPCHAINVFVPLVDLNSRNGPTEFVLGSHVLGHDGYDRDFLDTPKPKAGTPVVFDYRLGHRGMANSSQDCRPIVYCTYARASDGKAFSDSVNFSRKRYHKIGDLSAKPMSREERRNKRKRSIESALEKKEVEMATKVSVVTDESPKAETVVDTLKSEMANESAQAEGERDVKKPEKKTMANDATSEELAKVEKKEAGVDRE